MRLLVTGGAGYIGSVVALQLAEAGHYVTVFDNLSKGHEAAVLEDAEFVRVDLLDAERIAEVLAGGLDGVLHLAVLSLVGESVDQPGRYYRANIVGALNLLDAMRAASIPRLVFSSTAAVYGEPEVELVPIPETAPTCPTNPYGSSELAADQLIGSFAAAHGLSATSLRYFNVAGGSESLGEDHDPETYLISLVLKAALGERDNVKIFGTDYPTPDGTAAGFSVREVVEAARRVTGRPVEAIESLPRAGDPPVLVASSDGIRTELGWTLPKPTLEAMISDAWDWMREHPRGYKEG